MNILEDSRPLLIAGPCVIENEDETLRLAEALTRLPQAGNFNFIFKASYLKDNRSSAASYRGPGLEAGLEILARVKSEVGCRVASGVHCRGELKSASEVLDLIQVPAFLSRQTRLLEAAGGCGKPVNVKKGQFLAPEDMRLVVDKVKKGGCSEVIVTERGVVFGYHDLIVDFRSLARMKAMACPVVIDLTHSLQKPAGLGDRSGGEPELVWTLARAAAAVPCDGFFLETHFSPDEAASDAASMVPFSWLGDLLDQVSKIYSLTKEIESRHPRRT